jgi:hypothetical protein
VICVDRNDVVVAGHRPVGPALVAGGVVHRILPPQPLEVAVHHVMLEQVGIGRIEPLQGNGVGIRPKPFP